MDCQQLNESIKNLESELAQASEAVEDFSKSEGMDRKRLTKLDNALFELETKRDEVLEENLDEIFERHPEIFPLKGGEYDEKNVFDFREDDDFVRSVMPSETEVLVMANKGEARTLKKNAETNEWEYGGSVNGFRGGGHCVNCEKLSDTEILVGTTHGKKKILKKKEKTGEWKYVSEFDMDDFVSTSIALSDREILVMGGAGTTEIHRKNEETGRWSFSEYIAGFYGSEFADIYSSQKLSDTEILVMGEVYKPSGRTRILRKNEQTGEWHYVDVIDGFKKSIRASLKLSDTEILVMGDEGETRILKKNGGAWVYGDEISGFGGLITTSQKLSETEILVMGTSGETRILRKNEETGEWKYDKDEITGFGKCAILSSVKISETEILVTGRGGSNKILKLIKEKDLEILKKKIDLVGRKE